MLIRLWVIIALILGLAPGSSYAQVGSEYNDFGASGNGPPNGTQIDGMHACDGPHLISGIQIGDDLLLCLGVGSSAGGDIYRYIDDATETTVGGLTMHTCRAGFAMKGFYNSQGRGLFLCTRANLGAVHRDDHTERRNMHACPQGEVMVGIEAARNVLACAPVQN
jgi:hypothetical protein